ncbi:MAG TPA: hypothetical protein VL128_12325 [Candidatus Eisenbacteria bacterium]|nr:hypothetical protein [Candidatus Eisenbacteria bacterium]
MQGWKTTLFAATSFIVSGIACGQQPAAVSPTDTLHYDARRESTIVGTVVEFAAASRTAPLGARLTLQIASGTLEVHLGDPRLLSASHFSIEPGDTLRIIGETLTLQATQIFAARIVQKGNRALALRTPRGLLVPYVAPRRAESGSAAKGGA